MSSPCASRSPRWPTGRGGRGPRSPPASPSSAHHAGPRLPAPAALAFTAEIPDSRRLTGWEVVKDLAARCGGTLATARWDTGAVLSPVADLAGPELVERILAGLPDGYALLFGQAQLRPARAAA